MSISILWFISLPIAANYSAKYWESFPALNREQIMNFAPQAIIVIGGGLSPNATEYEQLATVNDRTLVRLRYAARLAHKTKLPLLVSGGRVFDKQAIAEAQVMADVLQQDFNTPVTWIEELSRNTRENAEFSYQLLKVQNIRKIILVTQAYHMPRAYSEFSQAGFQVLAAPTNFIHIQPNADNASIFSWIPSTRALHNNFLVVHEIMGMMWYRLI